MAHVSRRPLADSDIAEILDYIAEDSVVQAISSGRTFAFRCASNIQWITLGMNKVGRSDNWFLKTPVRRAPYRYDVQRVQPSRNCELQGFNDF
jgi:plasmid stabilization system protein ParE